MTTDDWRDHPRIREDHDDLGYTERDAELDRWLGYGIWVMAFLATWKFLDLVWSLISLVR